ncbi:MAG: cation:proton antiporter [Bacteroidetes bacterium]|nr:cation:proton antiporter [Bacteroidota bacterium]
MDVNLLKEAVFIFGASILIFLAFQRFSLPSVLAYMLAGMLLGNSGLGLIKSSHQMDLFAEAGIIFLLFIIGIEFSIKGLLRIGKAVFAGGSLQVGMTVLLVTLTGLAFGLPLPKAVFLSFLIALSSTAIVLKLLQEKGMTTSPHGKLSLAILIFQDIIIIPMILLVPVLAGQGGNIGFELLLMLGKFALVLAALYFLSRTVVPFILDRVIRTRSRELFLLTIVTIIFAVAWLTHELDLSLAIGAFFAGLIISESDYSHQATANVLPFRELFLSFFFVSVGMLLDLSFFAANVPMILALTLLLFLLKSLIVFLSVLILRYPVRTALMAAFALFPVGEFSFLLASIGMRNDLISEEIYQYFLASSIITMGLTPFLLGYAESISDFIIRSLLPRKVRHRLLTFRALRKQHEESLHQELTDHLVIVGYGVNGRNVSRAAAETDIPYIVVELDPDVYKAARAENVPIVFGDAADDVILHHVHLQKARVAVIAISDPQSTKKIITQMRMISETVHIIVRARYVNEIDEILRLGADEVIPEEFETSIEVFTRVLNHYLIPYDKVQSFVSHIRAHNYELLCGKSGGNQCPPHLRLHIPDMVIATLPVQRGGNKIVGKTLRESQLRTRFEVTVLAIRRGQQYLTNISPDTTIETDDMLYLFGHPEKIARVNAFLLLDEVAR